ncbi:hypothetical protein [Micromonospora sp. NPDC000668]|uniref:hypothetical protein n=1 Tax=Micromonospora sp. NPDC000668 TaxID=3364219 RepID=UPI0036BDD0AD
MAPEVSPRRARAVLVALSLAAFAFITTELLPVGLLTHIAPDLDRSRSQVGLLVSGYAVVVVLASVPLARLTQRVPGVNCSASRCSCSPPGTPPPRSRRRTPCWRAPAS